LSFWAIEWQEHDSTTIYSFYNYGTQAAPAAASSGGEAGSTGDVDSDGEQPFAIEVAGLTASVDPRGYETDVRVAPPNPDELAEYIESTTERASIAFTQPGPYPLVVTFRRPLSATEARQTLDIPGVAIADAEAIGRTADGLVVTVGGNAGNPDELLVRLGDYAADPWGIVAVELSVSSARSYELLVQNSVVLAADPAPTLFAQALAGARNQRIGSDRIDVQVNDLYWLYAGL
jgi:hypothetical protein